MAKSLVMFYETELTDPPLPPPQDIPTNIKITDLIGTYNSVKKIITLAQKFFLGSLADNEKIEAKRLFKDSNVQLLLDAAESLARRNEWVCKQFYGGLTGGITQISFGETIYTNLETMFALVLLGAIIGGKTIKVPISTIKDTLNKFKEEDAQSDYTTIIEPQTLYKTNV